MINPLDQLINRPFVHTVALFRVPKSASSTLFLACGKKNLFCREEKFLEETLRSDKKYGGLFSATHILPSESYKIFGRGILNFLSIACVRNPYARQVSQYSFSKNKGFGKYYGLPENGSFEEYCEVLWKRRNDKTFWPAILQSDYVFGVVPIKFLIHFEILHKDWARLLQEYQIKDLPQELTWENRSEHAPWQEYITDRSKEILDEVLDKDFSPLGYKKEIV